MNAPPLASVQPIRPDQEVMTKQRLPYFVGISGQTVGATGLSMHLVVIPPGAKIGFDREEDEQRFTVSQGGVVVIDKGRDLAAEG